MKNPKRHAGRKDPHTVPLGEPSPHLADLECDVWNMFKAEMSWLAESDRAIMEGACAQRARVLAGQSMDAKDWTAYRQFITALCGTPGERSKVLALIGEEPAEDPTAGYFQ